MEKVTIIPPETNDLVDAVAGTMIIDVVDRQTHEEALLIIKHTGAAIKRVDERFAPVRKAAHSAWKGITSLEKEVLTPLKALKDGQTVKAVLYVKREKDRAEAEARRIEDERRKRVEEERKAIEAQERKEREAMEAAQAAQDAGKLKEAEKIIEQVVEEAPVPAPEPVEAVVQAPQVAKVQGLSMVTRWSAEVVDREAFFSHIAKTGDFALIDINQTEVNARARREKGDLSIPGVRPISKTTAAGR